MVVEVEPVTHVTASGEVVAHALVEAVVGDGSWRFVLDTGTTDHVITRELAESLGLRLEPGESGTDSAGASVPSWQGGPLTLRLRSRSLAFPSVLVIDGPEPFERWGIGGILSPQRLDAAVALDLAAGELLLSGADDAEFAAALAPRTQHLVPVDLTVHASDLLTVPVRVRTDMRERSGVGWLDSGAARTAFEIGFLDQAQPDARTTTDGAVGGTSIVMQTVNIDRLSFGGTTVFLEQVSIRADIPSPDDLDDDVETPVALVGMDALTGSVLSLGLRSKLHLPRTHHRVRA